MGKFAAKGTLLKIGDNGSPESFNTIAHVTNIPGPETSREMMDATALDSAGGYKEYIPGLRDGGEVNIEGFFDATDTGQAALRTNLEDEETARNFQVVLPLFVHRDFHAMGPEGVSSRDVPFVPAVVKLVRRSVKMVRHQDLPLRSVVSGPEEPGEVHRLFGISFRKDLPVFDLEGFGLFPKRFGSDLKDLGF